MIRQKVTITNPTGLHLRPAGMFCNIASRYKCKVEFMYDDDVAANAKKRIKCPWCMREIRR